MTAGSVTWATSPPADPHLAPLLAAECQTPLPAARRHAADPRHRNHRAGPHQPARHPGGLTAMRSYADRDEELDALFEAEQERLADEMAEHEMED